MGNGQFGVYFVGTPSSGESRHSDGNANPSHPEQRPTTEIQDYDRVLFKRARFPYSPESSVTSPVDGIVPYTYGAGTARVLSTSAGRSTLQRSGYDRAVYSATNIGKGYCSFTGLSSVFSGTGNSCGCGANNSNSSGFPGIRNLGQAYNGYNGKVMNASTKSNFVGGGVGTLSDKQQKASDNNNGNFKVTSATIRPACCDQYTNSPIADFLEGTEGGRLIDGVCNVDDNGESGGFGRGNSSKGAQATPKSWIYIGGGLNTGKFMPIGRNGQAFYPDYNFETRETQTADLLNSWYDNINGGDWDPNRNGGSGANVSYRYGGIGENNPNGYGGAGGNGPNGYGGTGGNVPMGFGRTGGNGHYGYERLGGNSPYLPDAKGGNDPSGPGANDPNGYGGLQRNNTFGKLGGNEPKGYLDDGANDRIENGDWGYIDPDLYGIDTKNVTLDPGKSRTKTGDYGGFDDGSNDSFGNGGRNTPPDLHDGNSPGRSGPGRDGTSHPLGFGENGNSGSERNRTRDPDGFGRNGASRHDGFGRNGTGDPDGFGRNGASRRDGFGRNGTGDPDGFGGNGTSRPDGFGGSGTGDPDGFGGNGTSRPNGFGSSKNDVPSKHKNGKHFSTDNPSGSGGSNRKNGKGETTNTSSNGIPNWLSGGDPTNNGTPYKPDRESVDNFTQYSPRTSIEYPEAGPRSETESPELINVTSEESRKPPPLSTPPFHPDLSSGGTSTLMPTSPEKPAILKEPKPGTSNSSAKKPNLPSQTRQGTDPTKNPMKKTPSKFGPYDAPVLMVNKQSVNKLKENTLTRNASQNPPGGSGQQRRHSDPTPKPESKPNKKPIGERKKWASEPELKLDNLPLTPIVNVEDAIAGKKGKSRSRRRLSDDDENLPPPIKPPTTTSNWFELASIPSTSERESSSKRPSNESDRSVLKPKSSSIKSKSPNSPSNQKASTKSSTNQSPTHNNQTDPKKNKSIRFTGVPPTP